MGDLATPYLKRGYQCRVAQVLLMIVGVLLVLMLWLYGVAVKGNRLVMT